MKYFKLGLSGLLVLLVAYLLAWPLHGVPEAWTPPTNPGLTGPYKSNTRLKSAATIEVPGTGPEDITFDRQGRPVTGLEDGRIVRRNEEGSYTTLARTGGRPLGLTFGPDHHLYVADALKGLLRLTPAGTLEVLVPSTAPGGPGLANSVAVDSTGIVYFTDSSRQFGYRRIKESVIAHASDGRLLRYNPDTDRTTVLVDDLAFANGIALSSNEDKLYLNDMANYRILEVPLDGDRPVDATVFAGALPGFPDNVNRGPRGRLWVGLPTPRNALLDRLAPYPFLRGILLRLPDILRPAARRHGMILAFGPNGHLRKNLQDSTGEVAFTATAAPRAGTLYIGSYREPVLRKYDLTDRNE